MDSASDHEPPAPPAEHPLGSREPVDVERYVKVLEAVRTVPYSGEFHPDGSFHAPYTGPGVHLLLGGDVPEGVDGGEFWGARVLRADRALYEEGMALQQSGEPCEMEYRVRALDGRVLWFRECSRSLRLPGGVIRVDGIVMDVTEQRARVDAVDELANALRVTRGRLDSVLTALDEYLYVWRFPLGEKAVIDFESVPLATFLGRSSTGGAPEDEWLSAIHPDDRLVFEDVMAKGAAGVSGGADYRVTDKHGRTRWLHDRWQCRVDFDGGTVVEGIVSDITGRRRVEDRLATALAAAEVANAGLEQARYAAERAANTDAMTGLANRRSFQHSLEAAATHAADRPFGLILLDVDHFKRTNDAHGHQAGDDVLVAVVERLHGYCPPDAIIGRWGGEEFTVLLPGIESNDALRAVAEEIRRSVRADPLPTRRGGLAKTISCGGALSSAGCDPEDLLHAADAALYGAKQAGRDCTLLAAEAPGAAPLAA